MNVAPRQTRKRSHHAKPRSEGGRQIAGLIADARYEEAAVLSRLVDRALATQHHALLVVGTRFELVLVPWVTWQLQSLGTPASSPARVGIVRWLGGRPPVRQTGRDQEVLAHKSSAPLAILRCDFACPRFQAHRSCGRGGREMHVGRESASDDEGCTTMAFNIQGGAHCCAFEYDWTSLLCFCEDDGSTAIVGTRSLDGRSISKLTLAGREVFSTVWENTMAAHPGWLLSLMPLVLLGYGHVACIDKTMALLLSLCLSCGGGALKTFEDVLLSIRSIITDMGVEAGIPSIDDVLSQFAAVVKRRVSGTFQAYSRLMPRCVHVHDWHHLWAGVIKYGFEADKYWPSTWKKL